MESSSFRLPVRIKLTTPFLGDIRANGVRKFNMKAINGANYWVPKIAQWRWAFREAMDAEGLLPATSVDYIRFPNNILMPKVNLYSRAQDNNKMDNYECFSAGAVLSIALFVLGSLETDGSPFATEQRPPTKEEVLKCLAIVGSDIGLSPFGSKFNYGRFDVLPQ